MSTDPVSRDENPRPDVAAERAGLDPLTPAEQPAAAQPPAPADQLAPAEAGRETLAPESTVHDPVVGTAAVHSEAEEPVLPAPTGPSPTTVVWGLVLLVLAGLGTVYGLFDVQGDPVLVGAGLLAACGLVLLTLAVLGARRGGPRPR